MQIKSITILIFIERRVLIRLRISDEINYRWRNVERRAASGLFWIETAVVVFVSGAGLHADMPRQSWIWLILWKPVMVWLHTTYQSMDAILLDKWNESLLILSHRGKIDSVCVWFPRAVQLLFIGTSTGFYGQQNNPFGRDKIVIYSCYYF